jgi:hypothetical protein
MKFDQGKEEGKRPYEKPMLRTIELAAEEVLAGGCKVAGGGSAPLGATCLAVPCVDSGS